MKTLLAITAALLVSLVGTRAGLLDSLGFGMEKAQSANPFGSFGRLVLGSEFMDVDAYVTNKTLDGLFKMVAEEEKRIRENPIARTSELLQKVFGAAMR